MWGANSAILNGVKDTPTEKLCAKSLIKGLKFKNSLSVRVVWANIILDIFLLSRGEERICSKHWASTIKLNYLDVVNIIFFAIHISQ